MGAERPNLEKILANIPELFVKPIAPIVEYNPQDTVEKALTEVKRLEALGKEYQESYYNHKNEIQNLSVNNIEQVLQHIQQLHTATANIDILRDLIMHANDNVINLTKEEYDVDGFEEISDIQDKIFKEQNALRKQWFGTWRFAKQIKVLSKKMEKSWEAWSNLQRYPKVPSTTTPVNSIVSDYISNHIVDIMRHRWEYIINDIPDYQTNADLSKKQNEVLEDAHKIFWRNKQIEHIHSAAENFKHVSQLDPDLKYVEEIGKFTPSIRQVDMTQFSFEVFKNLPTEIKAPIQDLVHNEFTSQFLLTPEHTNSSQILGEKMMEFTDEKSILYNAVNFWRESGMSGQKPYIRRNYHSEKTDAQNYFDKLETLTHPALQTLKKNLSNNDHDSENTHEAVAQLITELLDGTSEETYFALNSIDGITVPDHLVEKITTKLDLSPVHNKELFQKTLDKITRRNTDISTYKEVIDNVMEYDRSVTKIKQSMDDPSKIDRLIHSVCSAQYTITNKDKQSQSLAIMNVVKDTPYELSSNVISKIRNIFFADLANVSGHTRKALDNFYAITKLSSLYNHPELQSIIENSSYTHLIDDPDQIESYMKVITKPKIGTKFDQLSSSRRDIIRRTAETAYKINKDFSDHFIENMVMKERSMAKMWLLNRSLTSISNHSGLEKHILSITPNEAYKTVTLFGLVRPIVDNKCTQDLQQIFESSDNVVDEYHRLRDIQSSAVRKKTLQKLQKHVGQAAVFKNQKGEIAKKRYEQRISSINATLNRERTNAVETVLRDTVKRNVEKIVGKPINIDVNEDIINATLLYNDITKNKTLLRDIIVSCTDGTYKAYSDDKNIEYLTDLRNTSINVDAWIEGVTQTYKPQLVQNIKEKIQSEIQHHKTEAKKILCKNGIEYKTFEEAYKMLQNINQDDALDLKTQIQAIKGLQTRDECNSFSDVTIYLEHDPLKILQMGNYSTNSCLGLGKGNAWSTVANALDSNKQVLYAVMNGEIIGRKLIAINNNKKMVQYRTYSDYVDLDLDSMFNTYLDTFADITNIERDTKGTVSTILAQHWYNDGILS